MGAKQALYHITWEQNMLCTMALRQIDTHIKHINTYDVKWIMQC